MATITELHEDLIDLNTMKFLTQAFTEASVSKLTTIRTRFERNTQVYQEISDLYHIVRVQSFKVKARIKNLPAVKPNILSVAITSNQRFYGNINTNIMRTFVTETEKKQTALTVVGLTGQTYMQALGLPKAFSVVTFHKDIPTIEEAKKFITQTQTYDQIFLYYPKFVSLVSQTVGISDITRTAEPSEQKTDELNKHASLIEKADDPAKSMYVLFEPEILKILDFFNKQVRTLLFMRTLLETEVALTAARIIAMSAAEERSDELIKEKRSEIGKTMASIINAKLLETFSAIREWEE